MSAFSDDHTKDMNNPDYAYWFGRNEREAEIIKLLEEQDWLPSIKAHIIALIKGEQK